MEILVNEKEYCKLDVRCEFGLDRINKKLDEVTRSYRNAHVPGFRPGKATLEAVRIHYKKQISESVKQALFQDAYDTFISEKNVKPIGQPSLSNLELNSERFVCDFSVNKLPDFELSKYQGFEIPKPETSSTVDEVCGMVLSELASKNGESVPYTDTDTVQMGDNVIISYDAFVDGEKQENLSSSGEMVVVGKTNVKDFDENLVGLKSGESKSFDITVTNVGLPSLLGKSVTFNVTLLFGSKLIPQEINDDLAAKLGKSTIEELNELAREMAQTRINEMQREDSIKFLQEKLIESHDFTVPEWLSLSEAKYVAHRSGYMWENIPDVDREKYLENAVKSIKLSMILEKIRENEPDAQLSDEEVASGIRSMIEKAGKSYDEEIGELSKNGQINILVARVRDEYVMDFVIKNSTFV